MLTLRGIPGPRRGADLNDLQIISDGSLLISKGVIKEVGPTRRIENLAAARGAIQINAVGKVVMPGFVDSHTHLAFPPPGADIDHDRAIRMVCASTSRRLRAQHRNALVHMARHGTTTVEVKTGAGPEESAEIKLLRVLDSLNGDPLDVFPTFLLRLSPQDPPAALDFAIRELLPKIRRRRLARFADVLWNEEGSPAENYASYLSAARELGLARKVHSSTPQCSAAVALAIDQEARSVDSLDQISEDCARMLARSQTIATLTPAAALHRCACRAARLLADSGAAIALASDYNSNHSGTLSMQAVVALAHLRMGLSINEAISSATINGAHALGCSDRVGSLEPGKLADVLILNTSDYRELGRHIGANLVHLAIKRGRPIYREAEVGNSVHTDQGVPARLC